MLRNSGSHACNVSTFDYNACQWSYVETVANEFLDELLKKVVVIFQKNKGRLEI